MGAVKSRPPARSTHKSVRTVSSLTLRPSPVRGGAMRSSIGGCVAKRLRKPPALPEIFNDWKPGQLTSAAATSGVIEAAQSGAGR